jgi:hypothetical protein
MESQRMKSATHGGRAMTPSLTVTRDAFVITIPRSLLGEARLDREILAALAAALSIEGLNEAAEYFSERAKAHGR